jgi:hypothetical protein
MISKFNFARIMAVMFLFVSILSVTNSYGYLSQKQKSRKSDKFAATLPPTIWQDPGDVASLSFVYGAGGYENAPKAPFIFKDEDKAGSNPKVNVIDRDGRHWGVKWGSEVHAEVFASRIAWAAGYYVEPAYYVRSGRIEGVTKVDRAKKYIKSDGSFTDARFELKEEGIKKFNGKDGWRFDENPFFGTKELNGLKIILMLTSNWDSKDQRDVSRGSNTAIFKYKDTGEVRYLVTDWGGSMGKWGSYFSREKWDCDGYFDQNSKFIKGVNNKYVEFGYSGQRTEDIREGIKVSDVRWLLKYVGRISDTQIRDGLIASGASQEELKCFLAAIRDRIQRLVEVAR